MKTKTQTFASQIKSNKTKAITSCGDTCVTVHTDIRPYHYEDMSVTDLSSIVDELQDLGYAFIITKYNPITDDTTDNVHVDDVDISNEEWIIKIL